MPRLLLLLTLPYVVFLCTCLEPRSLDKTVGFAQALCAGLALVSFMLGIAVAELKQKIAEVGEWPSHVHAQQP